MLFLFHPVHVGSYVRLVSAPGAIPDVLCSCSKKGGPRGGQAAHRLDDGLGMTLGSRQVPQGFVREVFANRLGQAIKEAARPTAPAGASALLGPTARTAPHTTPRRRLG